MDGTALSGGLKDDYLFRLTDDTGIFQHSKYGIPDPTKGYTTDDNARALIMAVMLYERYGREKYLTLIYRYASFILNAQNEKGRFKNFMSYDRRWLEEEGSEDCFGRCLWAIGFALSNKYTPCGVKNALRYIWEKAVPNVSLLSSPRAKAYSLIGLAFLDTEETRNLLFDTALSLCRQYEEHSVGEWRWFEEIVTYSNSVLPWSLFAAFRVSADKRFLDAAIESLSFLEDLTFKEGYFKPIGCHGWFPKGGRAAEFDEQPIEAGETVLTFREAYNVTGEKKYKDKAKICHAWYEGLNSKGLSLIDQETGGCFDGITEKGINLNLGAESLISYYLSWMALKDID